MDKKTKQLNKDVRDLVSSEYPYEPLQELIAEIIVKIDDASFEEKKTRYLKAIDAIIGKTIQQRLQNKAAEKEKWKKAYGIIQYLVYPYNYTSYKACSEYYRSKYLPNHVPGKRVPRDTPIDVKKKIKDDANTLYNGTVKGNEKKILASYHEDGLRDILSDEDRADEIKYVKQLFGVWSERYKNC